MTGPTYLGPEDDDLLPHGGPEHHTYRMPNGDIRCTACPLEVGPPGEAAVDYSQAAMVTWDQGWLARQQFRWYRWRLRRRLARALGIPPKLLRIGRPGGGHYATWLRP